MLMLSEEELASRINFELVVRIEVVVTRGVVSSRNLVSRNQAPPADALKLFDLFTNILHLTKGSKVNVGHVNALINC